MNAEGTLRTLRRLASYSRAHVAETVNGVRIGYDPRACRYEIGRNSTKSLLRAVRLLEDLAR